MYSPSVLGAYLLIFFTLYFGLDNEPKVPILEDTFWGPGNASEVNDTIRSFKIDISSKIINDLKTRLENTRQLRAPLEGAYWTYGFNNTYLQNTIVPYWKSKYNWTERQALLNRYPQYKTMIQGLDIHFYHIVPNCSSNVTVLPLLLLHGWPGSIVEFQKIIPMLTTPRDGFDFVFEVIAPSLPGFGFSQGAVRPGMGAAQIAVIMKNLMNRLGFEKFLTQGGDWGSTIIGHLAVLYPDSVIGTHSNVCICKDFKAVLWTVASTYISSVLGLSNGNSSGIYDEQKSYLSLLTQETGYYHIQASKPDTLGIGVSDSPAALAAYILEKFVSLTNLANINTEDGNLLEKFTMDELLDNVMVYWVTNSMSTAVRLYAEQFYVTNRALPMDKFPILPPSGCAIFPHELFQQSEPLIRVRYANLIQLSYMPRGGHFSAFEEPKLLSDDFWSFVHLLRTGAASTSR